MKERVVNEINGSASNGKEYAVQTYKRAVSLVESIVRSYWGETILERSEGRWVPHRIKPGIRDILRIKR